MTLRMSRPSFVGRYLQFALLVLANEKEEKFASKDNAYNFLSLEEGLKFLDARSIDVQLLKLI